MKLHRRHTPLITLIIKKGQGYTFERKKLVQICINNCFMGNIVRIW